MYKYCDMYIMYTFLLIVLHHCRQCNGMSPAKQNVLKTVMNEFNYIVKRAVKSQDSIETGGSATAAP